MAGKRVFIAGHRGMVGTALMRRLQGHCELLTASHAELDLRDQQATHEWIARKSPQAMIIAAAKVGGILANATYPAQFLYDNLAIATNTIEGARRAGVEKLLFLGSSCIYPRLAPQPIPESALMTCALWNRPTNGMRSPRLPVSKCAKPIAGNMAVTLFPPSPPIFTVRRTIMTRTAAMCCRP